MIINVRGVAGAAKSSPARQPRRASIRCDNIKSQRHVSPHATTPNMINTKRSTDEKTNWENQKEKLRTAFPSLTDEDVNFEHDRKNEMLGKLAMKLGKTTPELAAVMA